MRVTKIGVRAGRIARAMALLALGLSPAACDTFSSVRTSLVGGSPAEGSQGHITGFLGGVVSDEPRATVAAREVLSAGGNAADAAVTLGLMLGVTLPSRAGLGGGGACVAYSPARDSVNKGVPEAIVFLPAAPGAGRSGDRPAAIPAMARGLFALHARYGRRPFETLVAPAEQAARFGVPASRAFTRDLAAVSGALLADPNARAVFAGKGGQPLAEGEQMTQADLGATIAQLRTAGVGDLYQGQLARRFADASARAGGGVPVEAMRAMLPQLVPASTASSGNDRVSVPPIEGGAATLAALSGSAASGAGTLPASSTFATLDRNGNAVVCAVTMNNLFGTGRIAPGTGILLAASPAGVPTPLLAPAIAWNPNLHAFRAAVGGSGQGAAASAAAGVLSALLRGSPATPDVIARAAAEPGRANAIACGRYLPDNDASCTWATDPRGAGLAVGSN